mgnify:CR=1 FL=1
MYILKSGLSASHLNIFVFVLLLYVGSYCLLIEKNRVSDLAARWNDVGGIPTNTDPVYRWGGSAVDLIFKPIHWFDRRVRSHYWSKPEIFSFAEEMDKEVRKSRFKDRK